MQRYTLITVIGLLYSGLSFSISPSKTPSMKNSTDINISNNNSDNQCGNACKSASTELKICAINTLNKLSGNQFTLKLENQIAYTYYNPDSNIISRCFKRLKKAHKFYDRNSSYCDNNSDKFVVIKYLNYALANESCTCTRYIEACSHR